MTDYQVISEADRVPPMTGLEVLYVDEPGPIEGGFIAFATSFEREAPLYEPAVGVRCRVVRTRDGQDEEHGGAVEMVTPLRVALDGGNWKPVEQ